MEPIPSGKRSTRSTQSFLPMAMFISTASVTPGAARPLTSSAHNSQRLTLKYNSKWMNLATLPHHLDAKKNECRAIIETPKGRRNKFDYDPDIEAFTLGGLLPEGLSFPFDFGFVPSTVAEDSDPMDVIVLLDEPAHVGCVLTVRLIGVIEAQQTANGKTIENDRLIAVAVHSYA